MVYAALLCCAMLGDQKVPPTAAPSDLPLTRRPQSKRAATPTTRFVRRFGAKRTAERLKHLGLAILADPANALARGLLGMVEYQGK
jgi:hypothetical protein